MKVKQLETAYLMARACNISDKPVITGDDLSTSQEIKCLRLNKELVHENFKLPNLHLFEKADGNYELMPGTDGDWQKVEGKSLLDIIRQNLEVEGKNLSNIIHQTLEGGLTEFMSWLPDSFLMDPEKIKKRDDVLDSAQLKEKLKLLV